MSENTAKSAEDAAKSGDISSTLAELDRTLTETAQPAFDFQLDIDLNAMRYSMKPKLDGIKAADVRAACEKAGIALL